MAEERYPGKKFKNSRVLDENGLTVRERLFVFEYLVDRNASAAYKRAGYGSHHPQTIGTQAGNLLRRPTVAAAVEKGIRALQEKLDLTPERILKEISRIALSDIRRMYNADGSPKSVHELDDDVAACISAIEVYEEYERGEEGIKVATGRTKKIRLWDKLAALTQLGKYFNLFPDKHQIEGEIKHIHSLSNDDLQKKLDLIKKKAEEKRIGNSPSGAAQHLLIDKPEAPIQIDIIPPEEKKE